MATRCSATPDTVDDGDAGRRRLVLDGVKTCLPASLYADAFVVSASTPMGGAPFLVDVAAAGVDRHRQDTISYTAEALVTVDGVRVDGSAVLGSDDGAALAWIIDATSTAVFGFLIGITEEAVRLTAECSKTRQQFGHPIAMFQAVGQRAADARIDSQVILLTTLLAAWRLSAGLDAAKDVAVARLYAAEGGQRAVRAGAHLHGGMGVSREYPLRRYYVWAEQLELTLGSAQYSLSRPGSPPRGRAGRARSRFWNASGAGCR